MQRYIILICRTKQICKTEKDNDSGFISFSVTSISDTGYWEGSVGEREGWFPSEHIQEVRLRHKGRWIPIIYINYVTG